MCSGPKESGEPRVSVIVPVIEEQEQISGCLERLRAQCFQGYCQVIVVDGDPEGGTIRVVGDDRVVCLAGERNRGRQMNAGATAASGEILLFLHVDTRLPADALARIDSVMRTNEYVGGAFGLEIDSDRPLLKYIAERANRRSRLHRIPYGDQAIFLSRAYFQAIGGFRDIPIMEDLDLMRRIRREGGQIHILDQKVRTSARRWESEGPLYTTARNQILRMLYELGVSPEKLVWFYRIQNRIRRR